MAAIAYSAVRASRPYVTDMIEACGLFAFVAAIVCGALGYAGAV